MREAVEKIIKSLVDDAEAVIISEREDRATIFEVRVAPSDMGKLIGREGRTIKSLRTLIHAASLKRGRRFSLDIVE